MREADTCRVLTINAGSSSVKFALFDLAADEVTLVSGQIERIGLRGCRFRAASRGGDPLVDEREDLADHRAAVKRLLSWLDRCDDLGRPQAVGHRIVHGGPHYRQPHPVTPDLLDALEDLVPLDPDHLPQEIQAVRAVSRHFPGLAQVACFDTAFHRGMPLPAQTIPLPRHFREEGLVRYGFHGLSYEYIVGELRKEAGDEAADGRLVVAHLGSGASMAAIRMGRSIDTTMGLTPLGGLVMSTRCGDLDPGVLLYLLQERAMRPAALNDLLNHHAGLLGVSGTTGDMKDLLAREKTDSHAAEAVELFCHRARKSIAALCASLDGLDTLVFTGGIGENAPPIRQRIAAGLGFLGVRVDPARNGRSLPTISPEGGGVTVRVMKTNEELMIARHARRLLRESDPETPG